MWIARGEKRWGFAKGQLGGLEAQLGVPWDKSLRNLQRISDDLTVFEGHVFLNAVRLCKITSQSRVHELLACPFCKPRLFIRCFPFEPTEPSALNHLTDPTQSSRGLMSWRWSRSIFPRAPGGLIPQRESSGESEVPRAEHGVAGGLNVAGQIDSSAH